MVTAEGAEGEPYIFDLPLHDRQATESLVFCAPDPEKVQLLFDIVPAYARESEKIVGRALSSVRTNVGRGRSSIEGGVTLPIVEGTSLNVIGTISLEFITITPFEHEKISIGPSTKYLKSLIRSRVIGHRGLGKNEQGRKSLQLGENTLASFIAAAELGASYVEMDVQLTKDNIPVIYHDFIVGETGIDVPMHSLTLEQASLILSILIMLVSGCEGVSSHTHTRGRYTTLGEFGRPTFHATLENPSSVKECKFRRPTGGLPRSNASYEELSTKQR